ncbi:MAG: hypothetical protein JWM66_1573, partial [Solirubrobacterales bacterium]|nr:hypothetical protein [Solirubrobacterales bacterium]
AALLCEELALRARADLDQGRTAHAAIELRGAYAAALAELPAERREDLAIRVDELRKLRDGVERQAQATLAALTDGDGREAGAELAAHAPGVDRDVVAHALARLEATLRARTATGFRLR